MDHGIESREVLGTDVADVTGALLVAARLRAEVAAVIPAGIEADDLVPAILQKRHEDSADVTAVAIHQDLHVFLPPLGDVEIAR